MSSEELEYGIEVAEKISDLYPSDPIHVRFDREAKIKNIIACILEGHEKSTSIEGRCKQNRRAYAHSLASDINDILLTMMMKPLTIDYEPTRDAAVEAITDMMFCKPFVHPRTVSTRIPKSITVGEDLIVFPHHVVTSALTITKSKVLGIPFKSSYQVKNAISSLTLAWSISRQTFYRESYGIYHHLYTYSN